MPGRDSETMVKGARYSSSPNKNKDSWLTANIKLSFIQWQRSVHSILVHRSKGETSMATKGAVAKEKKEKETKEKKEEDDRPAS